MKAEALEKIKILESAVKDGTVKVDSLMNLIYEFHKKTIIQDKAFASQREEFEKQKDIMRLLYKGHEDNFRKTIKGYQRQLAEKDKEIKTICPHCEKKIVILKGGVIGARDEKRMKKKKKDKNIFSDEEGK